MTRVTIDRATQAKLQSEGPIELCSETGQLLGYFQPVIRGLKSPISDEEIQRLREQRDGARPLPEILKHLGET